MEKDFQRSVVYTVQDGKYAWIGVEKWTITDEKGTRTTKPALVKREKTRGRDGEERFGKAKGFSREEFELILNQAHEIEGHL